MLDGEASATGNAEGAAGGDLPAEANGNSTAAASNTSERNYVLEGQAPVQMTQMAQVDQTQGTATAAAPTTSPTNGIMKGAGHAAALAAPTTNKEDGDSSNLELYEENMMEIERVAEEDQKKEAAPGKGSASNSAAAGTSAATTANVGKEVAVDTAGNDAKGENEASSKAASEPEPANKATSSSAGDGSTRSTSSSKKDGNDDSDAAAAPPAVAPKENTGSNADASKPMQKTAAAKQPHLSAAVLERHNDSHQKQQQQQQRQQQQQPEKKTDKQIEPAVASTQFYGGTFPYYSSVSGPPPPSAIGYLNASILRATTAPAAASRQAQPSVRRPSASTSTAASTARMVTYSAYPPTKFPSVEEIEASIPADASSIFHIMDRRINFDNYTKDASFYSLLRGWVQDDPYRCNPLMNGQLLTGGDWAQVDDGQTNSVERTKKRRRVNDEPVDVLGLLQKQQGNTEQPTLLELRSEHVARAKKIHAEARKLDQLKMASARASLAGRYGITL